MNKILQKISNNKLQRKVRVRASIVGSAQRPRLSVARSNKGLYAQLIDDASGTTLCAASSYDVKDKVAKTAVSTKIGTLIAKKALDKNIKQAVLDRRGNKYHGRVKAVAEAAREAGLKI